ASERMRESLTRMIVHDLRIPLTSLLSGLYTLDNPGRMSDAEEEIWRGAIAGGETLLGMINDLLDISKMEDGALKLDYSHVCPATLADRAVNQGVQLARDRQISVTIRGIHGLPFLEGDEDKLRRTFVNLLGNAVKFTPTGGSVTLTGRAENGDLLFSVGDTGEGIPKEAF